MNLDAIMDVILHYGAAAVELTIGVVAVARAGKIGLLLPKMQEDVNELRAENAELREQNKQLKKQLDSKEQEEAKRTEMLLLHKELKKELAKTREVITRIKE